VRRYSSLLYVFFQAEDGIRDLVRSRGLGDVYKRQGLTFANESDYDLILEDDTFNFIDIADFAPDKPLTIELEHADGSKDIILANHTYNEAQIGWYREGSALNVIKRENQEA